MVYTPRLTIIPLTYTMLVTYLCAQNLLEIELNLTINNRVISPDVKEMVENFTLSQMKMANEADHLFYTFWIVIDQSSNTIVAELGFKGKPNHKGEIEIGYGTMPEQQGKGYMTEAVAGMIQWAAGRKDIQSVLAETDKDNKASIRIVEKNGFKQFGKKGKMLWWQKNLSGL